MAQQTTIQIRIDKKTKEEAKKILDNLGLDLSSAIKVFLKTVNITKSIPFELRTENGYTIAQEKAILRDVADTLKNSKAYESIEELHADILNE